MIRCYPADIPMDWMSCADSTSTWLSTFVAVCDSGSLAAAAPRVFRSPSSVSEQLAKLEERLGATLLERGKSGAAPTAAGTKLLAHARAILALNEQAIRDLTGARLEGELSLAISDYYRPSDIARVLQRLRADYPAAAAEGDRREERLDRFARGAGGVRRRPLHAHRAGVRRQAREVGGAAARAAGLGRGAAIRRLGLRSGRCP